MEPKWNVNLNQQEIEATILCQRAFRRSRIVEREKARGSVLQVSRRARFIECQKFVQTHRLTEHGVYKLMYLGPLPHVLVSLDAAHAAVMKDRKQIIRGISQLTGSRLDVAAERLKELKSAVNEMSKLQKNLAPRSAFHSKHDIEALKQYVLQVQDITKHYAPSTVFNEVKQDMYLGHRGIAEPAKGRKPAAEPTEYVDRQTQTDGESNGGAIPSEMVAVEEQNGAEDWQRMPSWGFI